MTSHARTHAAGLGGVGSEYGKRWNEEGGGVRAFAVQKLFISF